MEPIKDIDLKKDWKELAGQMRDSGGFVAKKLGLGVDILEKMCKDKSLLPLFSVLENQ